MPLLGDALARFGLYWLVVGRVGGALLLAPVFGSSFIPTQIKVGLVALLSAALLPLVPLPAGGVPDGFLPYMAIELHEVLLGLAIGYLVRLVLAAAEMAGSMLDLQLGFGITATVDPTFEAPTPIVGTFFSLLALVAFLLVNGHHLLIRALAASFQRLPLGAGNLTSGSASSAIDAVAWAFATAVEIAAPLLAIGILATVLVGLLGRAVPQLNLLVGGLPVQILIGIAALMVALPGVFSVMEAISPRSLDFVAHLVGG